MNTDAATTRAWIQPAYGGPEVLEQRTIDQPKPGKREALVRVRATGLNSADAKLLRGKPGVLVASRVTRPGGLTVAVGQPDAGDPSSAETDTTSVADEPDDGLPNGV